MGNFPLMLIVMALRGLGMSPMLGTLNAVIADASTYTYKKDKVHLDGVDADAVGNPLQPILKQIKC